MQQKRNITLKDIAIRAGISINAVSRALRDSQDISKPTKEKVRKIAAELGYVPDSVARNLKNDNSKIIALVYNDFYNPYFAIYCEKVFHYIKEKITGVIKRMNNEEKNLKNVEAANEKLKAEQGIGAEE